MKKLIRWSLASLFGSALIAALCWVFLQPAAATQPAPPSPPASYVLQSDLAQQMKMAIAKHADPALVTIGATDAYQIHEVHRANAGMPAIHPGATELHFILSGSGIFVTGGRITHLPGSKTSIVEGGVERPVRQGDAIIIPPNTPHWYRQVNGSLTYLEVRFVTPNAPAAVK